MHGKQRGVLEKVRPAFLELTRLLLIPVTCWSIFPPYGLRLSVCPKGRAALAGWGILGAEVQTKLPRLGTAGVENKEDGLDGDSAGKKAEAFLKARMFRQHSEAAPAETSWLPRSVRRGGGFTTVREAKFCCYSQFQ